MQFAQEAEVLDKVKASKVEPESLAIMSIVGEDHGHSDEEDVKSDFKDIQIMVKIMFDAFTTERGGEGSKPPYGEGSLDGKKDQENILNGSGGNPPPSPPSSSSSSSTSATKTTHTHSKTPKGKTPLLKLDIKFELPMYNGEVNAENLDNWIHQLEVY